MWQHDRKMQHWVGSGSGCLKSVFFCSIACPTVFMTVSVFSKVRSARTSTIATVSMFLQVRSVQVSTIATVSVFSWARVSFFLFFFFDLCWVLPTVYAWSESAVVANWRSNSLLEYGSANKE